MDRPTYVTRLFRRYSLIVMRSTTPVAFMISRNFVDKPLRLNKSDHFIMTERFSSGLARLDLVFKQIDRREQGSPK